MTLIPLKIPAGFYRTGTDLDASGKWRDGSLVRWRDGSLRPVGGWRTHTTLGKVTTYAPRGAHAWKSNQGTRYMAVGSYNELFAGIASGSKFDIKPNDLVAGQEIAGQNLGYGYGYYGGNGTSIETGHTYGTPRPDTGANVVAATTWSIDNWGEYLVACSTEDGRLLEWQLGTSAKAAPIANAPINNSGLIVTEERFIFALGSGGNPRKIAWCDRENNTVWSPLSTNEAGDYELQTSGSIQTAIRTRGQTLILTDVDSYTARYSGPPYVFGFERVGTSCGIISRKAAADTEAGVFWMGTGGFFRFDGNRVSEIPCSVHDHVFDNLNINQISLAWAHVNSEYGEIWWFYCSGESNEIDKYVAFDYKENHWLIGDLSRTTGAPIGVFAYSMLFDDDGYAYDHEIGLSYETASSQQSVFAETGPVTLGTGENIMQVTDLIPDEKTQGDVNIKFKSRFYPNATESTHGPFTPANPTPVRFSGRQIRMRIEGDTPYAAWNVGTMRIDAKKGGKR
jgi:hypothetical protein